MLSSLLVALALAADNKLINADALRGHVRFLASDALEGRGPASRGDTIAQQYIASQFEAAGLKPSGVAGTWYQPFDIIGIDGHPSDMKFSSAKGGAAVTLKFWDDLIAVAGEHQELSKLDASELVF